MEVKLQIELSKAEVVKLDPQPGEVLIFKLMGDLFLDEDVNDMGAQFRKIFPNNKCVVMALPSGSDVDVTVVKGQEARCDSPKGYCDDCHCGKKEAIESEQGEE